LDGVEEVVVNFGALATHSLGLAPGNVRLLQVALVFHRELYLFPLVLAEAHAVLLLVVLVDALNQLLVVLHLRKMILMACLRLVHDHMQLGLATQAHDHQLIENVLLGLAQPMLRLDVLGIADAQAQGHVVPRDDLLDLQRHLTATIVTVLLARRHNLVELAHEQVDGHIEVIDRFSERHKSRQVRFDALLLDATLAQVASVSIVLLVVLTDWNHRRAVGRT